MNIPNVLTLFRLALIPIYIVVFMSDVPYRNVWALFVVILAGLTDIANGYVARRYGWTTHTGEMLDPLADKLMMLTVFLSMLVSGHISLAAALAIFIRDAGMIVGTAVFHFRGKQTVPANVMGKATTVLYYVTFVFLLFEWPYDQAILSGTILFSYVTLLVYIAQIRLLNRKPT